ncbi:MAG: ATP-binding protein [Bacillota bacterium]|nr:ATP-binding protein [Bacillota bacterium]
MAVVERRGGDPVAIGEALTGFAREAVAGTPDWLEAYIRRDRLDERGLGDALRAMWAAHEAARQKRIRESGCGSEDELDWREREAESQFRVERMGAPARLWEAHYLARKLHAPAEAALAWAQAEVVERDGVRSLRGTCLVLSGPPGVGKSWAAVAAARYLADETGIQPLWAYAADALAGVELRDVRGSALATTPVLVVDDLGTDDARDRAKWDALFYRRHGNRRTTVVTTNLSPEAVRDRFGARVMDRLAEWATWRSFGGPSRRGEGEQSP